MCDEREIRDYATGSRFFVAAPGSRSEEERRSQRTACLERNSHRRLTAPPNHCSETYA
jgi:hypothetical protein